MSSKAKGRVLPRLLALALAGLGVVASGVPVRADTVDMTVSTLLSGHADPRDGQLHTVVPVYESLGILISLQRPFTDGIRIVIAGWGGLIWDVPDATHWTGDLDLGYVEGSFLKRRLQVRLGR